MSEKQKPAQPPSIGRIVHYVLMDGLGAGQHRPAMVVDVNADGSIYLHFYLKMPADREAEYHDQEKVFYDEATKEPGTWHYPEFVRPA